MRKYFETILAFAQLFASILTSIILFMLLDRRILWELE